MSECNQAIRDLLGYLNQRPFRKRREESRASLFAKTDRPALQPLPPNRYDLSHWSQARVNIDYHIAFDANFYSVPYGLTGEVVDVRATPATVEIFHQGKRVASHLRSRGRHNCVTRCRASSQESSGASGVDALAHGGVGGESGSAHGANGRADSGREAASGDGLPGAVSG